MTTSYRFRRRAFLTSVGGAFGLKILLRNLEASASGTPSPPRLLVVHWPNGTVRTEFLPTETGTGYVTTPLLQPFEDKGLRSEMIGLFGLNHNGIMTSGSGPEGGTVNMMTGAHSPGTRQNMGEPDDSVAGGPSWDQILLKHAMALAPRDASGGIIGPGSVNAICDARVDYYETSSRCLSYGYETRPVESARPGGTIVENVPRLPTLSPASLYATLFSGFTPDGSRSAALRSLRMRKSVLDSTLRELSQLSALAPAAEREKIEIHAATIRSLEQDLAQKIADGGAGTCMPPTEPPATAVGKTGDVVLDANEPRVMEADDETHETVGRLHMSVIRAAFQCDIVRVATFQWAPGTGHVALSGLDPNEPDAIYIYRSLSRRAQQFDFWTGPRPTADTYIWDVFVNAQRWYNVRLAEMLAEWKTATDAFGNNLLDHTVIPCVTEIAHPASARNPLPALMFGGRALGMNGGQFQLVSTPQNSFWATIAQAYLGADAMAALADEVFVKTNVAPIPDLWTPT